MNDLRRAALRWEMISAPGDGGIYQLDGRDEEGRTWQDPAALFQHYGHRSRLGARAQAIVGFLGGIKSQRVMVATRSPGDDPPELADWEADVYSRFKQRIHLREDGSLYITTDKGHRIELRADGRIFLHSKGGAEVELDASDLTTSISHITGRGGTPTVLPEQAGLGSGGQAVMSGGTDNAFQVTLTADSMTAPGGGDVCTVTFATPFKDAPFAIAGMVSGNGDAQPYISSIASDKLTIGLQKAPLQTGGIYNVTVLVTG